MSDASFTDQDGFRVKLDWGWDGAARAAARGEIVVIVDVLRFSSAVTRAVERGAIVFPCEHAAAADEMARRLDAIPAARSWSEQDKGFSLSPRSFDAATPGTRVVLPSPNGATCTLRAAPAPYVFAGSFLNASSIGRTVSELSSSTGLNATVIACGERWQRPGDDGALRFALEDYLGAGAIISRIGPGRSPEAGLCAAAFESAGDNLASTIVECGSGRELFAKGLEQDVHDCLRVDAYGCQPLLRDGGYAQMEFLAPSEA